MLSSSCEFQDVPLDDLVRLQLKAYSLNDENTLRQACLRYDKVIRTSSNISDCYNTLIFKNNMLAWETMTRNKSNSAESLHEQYKLLTLQIHGLNLDSHLIKVCCCLHVNWLCCVLDSHDSNVDKMHSDVEECITYCTQTMTKVWKVVQLTDPPRCLQDFLICCEDQDRDWMIYFQMLVYLVYLIKSVILTEDVDSFRSVLVMDNAQVGSINRLNARDRTVINMVLDLPGEIFNADLHSTRFFDLLNLCQAVSAYRNALDFKDVLRHLDCIKSSAWKQLADFYKAFLYFRCNEYTRALTLLTSGAISGEIPSYSKTNLIGKCLSAQFHRSFEDNPYFPETLLCISEQYRILNKPEHEIKALDSLIKVFYLDKSENSKCEKFTWYNRLMFQAFRPFKNVTEMDARLIFARRQMELGYYESAASQYLYVISKVGETTCIQFCTRLLFHNAAFCLFKCGHFRKSLTVCNEIINQAHSNLKLFQDDQKLHGKKRMHSGHHAGDVDNHRCRSSVHNLQGDVVAMLIKIAILFELQSDDDKLALINGILDALHDVVPGSSNHSSESFPPDKKTKFDELDSNQAEKCKKSNQIDDVHLKLKSDAYYYKARAVEELADGQNSALHHYQLGLMCNPGNKDLIRRLCKLLVKCNRKDEARQLWMKSKQDLDVGNYIGVPHVYDLGDANKLDLIDLESILK
ncbi:Uncharacterised protein r2_g501 [Pycnogonum litorale]